MIPAFIPARAGSKSVPNKNMRLLKGKPLLQYAIEAAKSSALIDKDFIFISTDSPSYGRFAENLGANWIRRPQNLAEDVATEEVIIHALNEAEKTDQDDQLWHLDPIVTLQCTTPLMDPEDIDGAIRLYQTGNYRSVVSVTEVREHPRWMFKMEKDRLSTFLKRDVPGPFDPVDLDLKGDWGVRQTREPLYRPNGAIYVTNRKELLEKKTIFAQPIGGYKMPASRSWDVDDEIDLKILECLAS